MRADILLNRLCLTRSRSEAKNACDAGAVLLDDRAIKASHDISAGDRLVIRYPNRIMEFELIELPGKSVSKKAARDLYEIIREDRPEPSV